jgi:hypothetical protein
MLSGQPILQPAPPQSQNTGHGVGRDSSDKDDKKDKGKRLGQACGACRKRKVGHF